MSHPSIISISYNSRLANIIEEEGGVEKLIITHRDNCPDHERWKARFPALQRVIHRADAVLAANDCEVRQADAPSWSIPFLHPRLDVVCVHSVSDFWPHPPFVPWPHRSSSRRAGRGRCRVTCAWCTRLVTPRALSVCWWPRPATRCCSRATTWPTRRHGRYVLCVQGGPLVLLWPPSTHPLARIALIRR